MTPETLAHIVTRAISTYTASDLSKLWEKCACDELANTEVALIEGCLAKSSIETFAVQSQLIEASGKLSGVFFHLSSSSAQGYEDLALAA